VPARRVEVTNPLGIHARPAARFVKAAAGFDAEVTVTRGGTTIDGKSILGLLFLAAAQGTRITIRTQGPEAEPALDALSGLVVDGIGEQGARQDARRPEARPSSRVGSGPVRTSSSGAPGRFGGDPTSS